MAGRTTVDPPLIGWVLALNDGMTVRSWSFGSPAPWLRRSVADRTSTGTADGVALRGSAREPTTTGFLGESGEQALHLRGREPQRLDLRRRHSEHPAQRLDQFLGRFPYLLLRSSFWEPVVKPRVAPRPARLPDKA